MQGEYVNLDDFRAVPHLNYIGGDIRAYYYSLWDLPIQPQIDFSQPQVKVQENSDFNGKIGVIYTNRYNNPFISYKSLKKYEKQTVFLGLQSEYNLFRDRFGVNPPFFEVKDALQMAVILKSCKICIGNLSGNYSIAQTVKANRILIPQEYITFNDTLYPLRC